LGEVLAIAEGIETALSFQKLSSVPTVAALDAGKIAHVAVPDRVRELIIAADHDRSGAGLKAAKAAMQKHWKPWRLVRVLMPNHLGDFNDLLIEGRHG
jgi:putative DNA primase/helicase